jgi:hypothetical protein
MALVNAGGTGQNNLLQWLSAGLPLFAHLRRRWRRRGLEHPERRRLRADGADVADVLAQFAAAVIRLMKG